VVAKPGVGRAGEHLRLRANGLPGEGRAMDFEVGKGRAGVSLEEHACSQKNGFSG
jgi:hypothetical protein